MWTLLSTLQVQAGLRLVPALVTCCQDLYSGQLTMLAAPLCTRTTALQTTFCTGLGDMLQTGQVLLSVQAGVLMAPHQMCLQLQMYQLM